MAPNGPSVRFHLLNAHTMDELKMTGNCLKGSRPIVVFDHSFDESPHLRIIKEILTQASNYLLHSSTSARYPDNWVSIDLCRAQNSKASQAFR